MDEPLNLFEQLLARARRYQELGQSRQAARALAGLLRFPDLPDSVTEEASARLAVLHLKRGRFRAARRRLAAALRLRPDSARYHHLLARAVAADDSAPPARAERHYRRALELEPGLVRCRSDAGLLALRLGKVEEGLALLREAVRIAPDDPEALGKMVKGLRQAGRDDEARAALRTALFRRPRSARLHRLRADVQLQDLRRRREADRGACREDGPVLLPFLRPVAAAFQAAPRRVAVRPDEPATLRGPHTGRAWRQAR